MNHFSSTVSTIVRQKRRSEGYLLVLLVHGFLVLRESRRSLSVEPVQVVTLCAKVTCTGMNGVEIMTRVPRRHGDRHGESKDTSTKISNFRSLFSINTVIADDIVNNRYGDEVRGSIPTMAPCHGSPVD